MASSSSVSGIDLYKFEVAGGRGHPIQFVLDWFSSWAYLFSLLAIHWVFPQYAICCHLIGVTYTFISCLNSQGHETELGSFVFYSLVANLGILKYTHGWFLWTSMFFFYYTVCHSALVCFTLHAVLFPETLTTRSVILHDTGSWTDPMDAKPWPFACWSECIGHSATQVHMKDLISSLYNCSKFKNCSVLLFHKFLDRS